MENVLNTKSDTESGQSQPSHVLKTAFAHIAQSLLGHWAREYILRIVDVLLWVTSMYLASQLLTGFLLEESVNIYHILLYIFPLISIVIFPIFGCYQHFRSLSYISALKPLFLAIMLVSMIAICITFLMHEIATLSRMWFLLTVMFVFGATGSVRLVIIGILRWLRSNGYNLRQILVISNREMLDQLLVLVHANSGQGYKIIGAMSEKPSLTNSAGIIYLDQSSDINRFIINNKIDEVWVASYSPDSEIIHALIDRLQQSAISVRWLPDLKWLKILGFRSENLMGQPSLVINATLLECGARRLAKSIFDRLFAVFVLLLLSPLIVAIAFLIKLSSPGTVLFKQVRHGVSGKPFTCLKFRTMVMHAEHGTVIQATYNDSRVTPIGKLLRSTSLDELPQFINVLLGDMSIVGPRPHAMLHNEYYCEKVNCYMQRHRAKPGITGWAQVNGYRGETDTLEKMAKRIEFDLYYLNNWSFWLDIKIIVRTVLHGWSNKNAY